MVRLMPYQLVQEGRRLQGPARVVQQQGQVKQRAAKVGPNRHSLSQK